jgi:hypothetical protein
VVAGLLTGYLVVELAYRHASQFHIQSFNHFCCIVAKPSRQLIDAFSAAKLFADSSNTLIKEIAT